jgi:hypothetical protein
MTEATAQYSVQDPVSKRSDLCGSLEQENAQLRQKLADMNARLDRLVDERLAAWITLRESDQQIQARLDPEHVLNTALDWALLITSAVAGALYLIAEPAQPAQTQKTVQVAAQRGYWPEMDFDTPLEWPVGQDILARVLETRQAVHRSHVCEEIALSPQDDTDRSHLAVPICQPGRPPIGVLALESAFANGFTEEQIDRVTRLAERAAPAIQNAIRFQQVNQRLETALAIHQSSLALASCPNVRDLPRAIVQNAIECLQAERAALYHYDRVTATWGLVQVEGRVGGRTADAHPSEHSLVASAAQAQSTQSARDPAGTDVVALPLAAQNPLVNAIQVDLEIPYVLLLVLKPGSSPSSIDLHSLNLYADQASMALKNAGRLAQLEYSAQRQRARARDTAGQSKASLTAVQGYARLMLEQIGGEVSGQQREFLETILKHASQLERLLDKQLEP